MHVLQSFCIAMFLSLFRHNKTPKVFCLTFGVHVTRSDLFFALAPALMASAGPTAPSYAFLSDLQLNHFIGYASKDTVI